MAFETINRGESNWASKINNNFAEVSNIVAGSDKVSTTDFEAYKTQLNSKFNIMAKPLNFVIPINVVTVSFMTIFGLLFLPFFAIIILFFS